MIWRKVKHIFAVFQIFLTKYSKYLQKTNKMHKMTQRMDRESSVRGLRMMVGYLRRCRAARQPPRHRTSPWVGLAGSATEGAAGLEWRPAAGTRLHYGCRVHKKRMRKAIRRLTISHSPLSSGGADGTRTRDPRRDRPVF